MSAPAPEDGPLFVPRLAAVVASVVLLLFALSLRPEPGVVERPVPSAVHPASAPAASPSTPPVEAADPLQSGLAALSTQDYANAVQQLRRASEADPQDPAVHYLLAVALTQDASAARHSDEDRDQRRRAAELAPGTGLGETPQVSLASPAPMPEPSVAVAVTPKPVTPPVPQATAASSPSPLAVASATEDAVEYNFPPPPASPPPAPSPAVTPSRLAPGTVLLSGTLTRPDEHGNVVPVDDKEISLLAIGEGTVRRTTTDSAGRFAFEGVEPRYDYYLVAVCLLGTTVESAPIYQQVPGPNGTTMTIPMSQRVEVRHDLSWHQALDLSRPGRYDLLLDRSNADPSFAPDVQPAFDSVQRSYFHSYRIGAPAFTPP